MSVNVFSSSTHESRTKPTPVTGNKVGEYRVALDNGPLIGGLLIGTDLTEAGTTDSVIVATAHSARAGDAVVITTGTLISAFATVHSVSTNEITLAQKLSSTLAVGVGFSIYRPIPIPVDSSGIIVSVTPSYAQSALVGNGFLVGGVDSTGTTFERLQTIKLTAGSISGSYAYVTTAAAALGYQESSGDFSKIRSIRDSDSITEGSSGNLSVFAKLAYHTGSVWNRVRGSASNGILVDVSRVVGTVTTSPTGGSFGTVTTTTLGVTTSSQVALSANSARKFAFFQNGSDTTIYIKFGGTAFASTGIRLNANGASYEINSSNLYTGQITAIHAGTGSKTLLISEG